MKNCDTIVKLISTDDPILNKIIFKLKDFKERRLICGIYVGTILFNDIENIIQLPYGYKYKNIKNCIFLLRKLGYICTDAFETPGYAPKFWVIPGGCFFHVNYKLTFFQRLKFILFNLFSNKCMF